MPEKITREFTRAGDWKGELEKLREEREAHVYARGSYPELREREKEIAEVIGVEDAALFNAGMGAIHTTIETERFRPGEVVLCGKDVYISTEKLFKELEGRGVKVEIIDSSDMDEIKAKIGKLKPRAIILESVGNAPNMPVCDIGKLLEYSNEANERYSKENTLEVLMDKWLKARPVYEDLPEDIGEKILKELEEFKQGGNPFVFRQTIRKISESTGQDRHKIIKDLSKLIKFVLKNERERLDLIIDNTLPSPMLYNPLQEIKQGNLTDMIVVESATKHYQKGEDRITMGVAYSNNPEKVMEIKMTRTHLGTYLQPTSEEEIPHDALRVMPEKMRRHAENALELAKVLSKFPDKIEEVNHPNLPDHRQNELVQKIAPEGLVSLFYIKVKDNDEEFAQRVKDIAKDKISIGASFGHPKTWILPLGDGIIRIAVGSESEDDFKKVMECFEEALKHKFYIK